MPFVKRDTAIPPSATAPPTDGLAAHIATLESRDAEARWQGARALVGRTEAVAPLAAALGIEPIPRVREAIMTALTRIGNAASVEALLPYLRSQDAGQRAAAIEALQGLPHEISPFLSALLADGDSDGGSWPPNWRAIFRPRKRPGCCASCSPLNRTPTFAGPRSTCSLRSAPKMPFRRSSSAPNGLPTRRSCRSLPRKPSR
jgi:hypothetical protein